MKGTGRKKGCDQIPSQCNRAPKPPERHWILRQLGEKFSTNAGGQKVESTLSTGYPKAWMDHFRMSKLKTYK